LIALFSEPRCKTKPNLIGFWPLNSHYGGKNLATENVDFELRNVLYAADGGMWKFPPASFRKRSVGELSRNHLLRVTRSYSWIGAVYRRSRSNGPLFEWGTGEWFQSYIWIWDNKIHIVADRTTCERQTLEHTSTLQPFQWYVFAATLNGLNNTLSLYVNGHRQDKVIPPCAYGMVPGRYIYINFRYVFSSLINLLSLKLQNSHLQLPLK
jgi:hypothetical protein